MATSSQTPSAVLPLHEAPRPLPSFVDRDGDLWVPNGRTADGELLLACPAPQDPADAGAGESFPWTLRSVRLAFGPLKAVAA
ncbi:hypothetical protein [Streptomyces sp. ALI-76-A]|jgi:hypothetical protein|uniref:hypothetical protein n=1 Tax=Streptomyces sp. ALI-76-A TaxID=3025736 RepID=UPI00256EF243|nr:hypothetical protein [Streptomyces sp. ALI-76-A]MDL5205068.1 hypothetical protein [Streptomyces sp. ALI-76-A]